MLERSSNRPPNSSGAFALAASAALVALGFGRDQNSRPVAAQPNNGEGIATGPRWKAALWRVYNSVINGRLLTIAAGVTFYALLAIFPAVTAFVSLYGLFSDPSTVSSHLDQLSGMLPEGAVQVIGDQMKRVVEGGATALGFAFFFGLAVALWSANSGMKAIFDALNIVYKEEEKRSFIVLNLVSLSFTLAAIVLLIVAIGAIAVIPAILAFIGLGGVLEWVLWAARWPFLLTVLALGLAVLYRFGPSRENARWRWISWGSAWASVLLVAASMLFSYYAANFGSFNATYGTLGAVIGFMLWIWISTTVVLIGGEINAGLEKRPESNLVGAT